MSKLYCAITESARRTQPTARAHKAATVMVKNWRVSIQTRIVDCGGGESDRVTVILNDGASERVLIDKTVGELL